MSPIMTANSKTTSVRPLDAFIVAKQVELRMQQNTITMSVVVYFKIVNGI